MKSLMYVVILLFVVFQLQAQRWNLIWSDEFNYSGLPDSSKWFHDVGNIKNNELQCYTFKRIENSKVENGNLLIIGRKETYQDANYTSARLTTEGIFNFCYGKIEARIKISSGQGIWPAFWLLGQNINQVGSPKCGEIDIMEHVNEENVIHSTMHWDNDGLVSSGKTKQFDVNQFHIYAVEWDKYLIKWYLDGKKYYESKINESNNNADEFRKPFFILLNLAIGGNWSGKPNESTLFPDTMSVDYIRVYQKQQ